MTKAHEKSILGIKTCLPVDTNTTFLGHFDVTLNESLYDIAPDGTPIATLRRFEGRFGGGVAIEEGTTNKIETEGGASQDWSKWSHWGNRTYWSSETQYDDPIMGKIYEGVNANGSDTFLFYYYPFSFSAGTTYTGSIYLKVDGDPWTGNITLYLNRGSDTAWLANGSSGSTVTLVNHKWTRIEFSVTPSSNPSGGGGFGWKLTNFPVGKKLYAAMPQLEQKSFATSFVKGTRNNGYLAYPKHVINPKEGTIYLWINTKGPLDWARIIRIGQYSSPITTDEFRLLFNNASGTKSVSFEIQSKTSVNSVVTGHLASVPNNTWVNLAVTWSETDGKIQLIKNGELIKESSVPSGFVFPTYDGYSVFSIDYGINAIIDELRIDQVKRSLDEIQSWYQSQTPFYPKGVHKIYF